MYKQTSLTPLAAAAGSKFLDWASKMKITTIKLKNQYFDWYDNFQSIACACTDRIKQAQQSGNKKEAYQFYMGKHHLIKLMKLFRNRDAN